MNQENKPNGQENVTNVLVNSVNGVNNANNANSVTNVNNVSNTNNISATNTSNVASGVNSASTFGGAAMGYVSNGSFNNVNNMSANQNNNGVVQADTVGFNPTNLNNSNSTTPGQEIVDDKSKEQVTQEKNEHPHEVTEVLSSSFANQNKVNLLTPEQRDELNKKREEAMREKENYQPAPVSKFKMVMSGIFIIVLLLVVLFLPEINSFILTISNKSSEEETVITTGTLKCTDDLVDEKYNISYDYEFQFTDSQLGKLTYIETTVGDKIIDADDLNAKLEKCNNLKNMVAGLNGIKVMCSLSDGTFTREQVFDYGILDVSSVTTAYMEAGGEYPGEFSNEANIDSIEKNMKAAGRMCERYH